MATFARIATRLAATTVAFAAGIALAPAASASTDKESLDVPGLFSDEIITGRLLLDDTVARLVDVNAVTQTVDALGKTIGSPQTVALRTGSGNSKVGSYSCLPKTNGNKDFHQFKPTEIFRSDDKGKVQGLFHVYRQDNARRVLRAGDSPYQSVQFEVCGVGGSDPDKSVRTRRAGIGIAFASTAATYKIGEAWKTGETPSNFTMDMAFKAAYKGVEIGGGISQTPTNKLLGSMSTPFEADTDMYARNAVNAWWQDGCVGSWKGCQHWNGSKDFHGAVAHGLFEFTPQQSRVVAREGFLVSTFRSTN